VIFIQEDDYMNNIKMELYRKYRDLMRQAKVAKSDGDLDLCVNLCMEADEVLEEYLKA